jgi:hypothetical protein
VTKTLSIGWLAPSEFYREGFGGEMAEACEFASLDRASGILGPMMRHLNTIAGTPFKGEFTCPCCWRRQWGRSRFVSGNRFDIP